MPRDITKCPLPDAPCQRMQYELRQFALAAKLTDAQKKRLRQIAARADKAK